jgi:hypothetical protein
MEKVESYRKHAEECRTLAQRPRSLDEREMLLNMAKTWEDLATARMAQISQQQRLKDIAAGPGGDDRAAPASIPIDRLNASNDE